MFFKEKGNFYFEDRGLLCIFKLFLYIKITRKLESYGNTQKTSTNY